MSVNNQINRIKNEVDMQTDLITELDMAVDALPEAGSGGETVETCTVTIGSRGIPSMRAYLITYTLEDGINILSMNQVISDTVIEHVVCNSIIAFRINSPIVPGYTVSGGAKCINTSGDSTLQIFSIPQSPTENVSIIIRDDD